MLTAQLDNNDTLLILTVDVDDDIDAYVDVDAAHVAAARATVPEASAQEWHRRLGHAGSSQITQLKKEGLIKVTGKYNSKDCTICSSSKATKQPSHRHFRPTEAKYDCLHVDVIGGGDTLPQPSAGGNQYLMVITDDFTDMKWAIPLKTKGEQKMLLEAFLTSAANKDLYSRYPRRLRTDNDFKSIKDFYKEHSIQ